MLFLCRPESAIDPSSLERPQGFAWWYADLLNDAGDGMVLIWSFGLPFLPGPTPVPRERPALNVALYRAGRPAFYLLQECAASWEGERWTFDRSTFERSLAEGSWRLDVRLDCALPGTRDRLRGTVRMHGPRARHETDRGVQGAAHRWGPVSGPSHGEAQLSLGGERVELAGRAYHDCNSSTVALGALGLREWTWGRASLPDEERVWYLLDPEPGGEALALGFAVRSDGSVAAVDDLRAEARDWRRDRYGVRWPAQLRLREGGRDWLTVTAEAPVDAGPFYLRFMGHARCERGRPARCVQEVVRPGAVDVPWQRPFVRMRVHDLRGANSPFVPLFTGPSTGRLTRLLRHWRGGR